MIRVSVMYSGGDGKTFDYDYYVNKHIPLVRARWGSMGLETFEFDRGVAGGAPGSVPPYIAVAHLVFGSLEQYQKAGKAHGKELFGDVPNFTNITPQVQIAEIVHRS